MIFIVLFVSCLLAQTDPLPPGTGNKYCKMFFKAKLHCQDYDLHYLELKECLPKSQRLLAFPSQGNKIDVKGSVMHQCFYVFALQN